MQPVAESPDNDPLWSKQDSVETVRVQKALPLETAQSIQTDALDASNSLDSPPKRVNLFMPVRTLVLEIKRDSTPAELLLRPSAGVCVYEPIANREC